MTRLRVLSTADTVGGVWNYSLDLARGLAPLGVDTMLAVIGPPPTAAQRKAAKAVSGLQLVETGRALDWVAPDADALAQSGAAVAALAAKHQVDIVQLNAPAIGAGIKFPAPVIAVAHSCLATWWDQVKTGEPLPPDFAWRTEAMKAGLAAADLVVAPTKAFAALVARRYRLQRIPTAVHNGRSPIAGAAQAPHDFIFTSGRLWDQGKNLRTLDAAAQSIGVPVHAAGSLHGPNGDGIRFDHINALGRLEEAEMARWLRRRPVFASAAIYEPFGLAVLEAAAAGCPLVLADTPTFRELWDEVALFVDPMNPAGFALACNDLVGDDYERAAMGRAAQERAAAFTPAAMAAQMANLYRALLPAVRRRAPAARAAA